MAKLLNDNCRVVRILSRFMLNFIYIALRGLLNFLFFLNITGVLSKIVVAVKFGGFFNFFKPEMVN